MKRLIAIKKHKNGCDECGKQIIKGDVYYTKRKVFTEDDKVYAWQYKVCAKCNYYGNHHSERYVKFTDKCIHPEKFIDTEWRYIPGECVKEPDYDYCRLCGAVLF
ncbi:MAG: hypothetical protein K0Q53_152 [Massilibacillus sp.]|jgi:hypothetical protein|nr:hypothetical protein [Massilibacillus sp.]